MTNLPIDKWPKQSEMEFLHQVYKGWCPRCKAIRALEYDIKGHLICSEKNCHSLYCEILYLEIEG